MHLRIPISRAALALAASSLVFGPSAQAVCVRFTSVLPAGPWACCGVNFNSAGVGFKTRPFIAAAGPITTGSANVVMGCFGGGGFPAINKSLELVEIRVQPNVLAVVPAGAVEVTFDYHDFNGQEINLGVNGLLARFTSFSAIPAGFFVPVGVNLAVAAAPDTPHCIEAGTVTLTIIPGTTITSLSIGGREICVDDLCIN